MLNIKHLSKTFILHEGNKKIHALHDISMELHRGEFIGITGKSGSGKSTILKSIYRTYIPSSGMILYNSHHFGEIDLAQASERQILHLRRKEMGYVSQFLNVMPRTSARDLVIQACMEIGVDHNQAAKEAVKMLSHFELDPELWDSYPNTFSGGEKLRLNIARAMVKHPKFLLLDEPTASLDHASKAKVHELLMQLKQEGATMIGIFHDIEFMQNLCDREYKMLDGKLLN